MRRRINLANYNSGQQARGSSITSRGGGGNRRWASRRAAGAGHSDARRLDRLNRECSGPNKFPVTLNSLEDLLNRPPSLLKK